MVSPDVALTIYHQQEQERDRRNDNSKQHRSESADRKPEKTQNPIAYLRGT